MTSIQLVFPDMIQPRSCWITVRSRQSYRAAHHSVELSPELTCRLRQLSRAEGTTLFMMLLAGFLTLLYRYTGQTDLLLGSPVANRQRRELEPLIGFFVNTLALRSDLSGDPPFREVVARVREMCQGAYAHEETPFERLIEELRPERDLSRQPLVQVMFGLRSFPKPVEGAEGIMSPAVFHVGTGRAPSTCRLC